MKINKIEVKNFKAIADQEINLAGAHCIVTGGNNKGKTSLLYGLIGRLRSEKPDIILKTDARKGWYKMELTDGSVITWEFTDKTEKLSYTTPDGFTQTQRVISQIGERYFGDSFDIDSFIKSTPKVQLRMMEELIGVDFSSYNDRYAILYNQRTAKKKQLESARAMNLAKPEKVGKPDIETYQKNMEAIVKAEERYQIDKQNYLDTQEAIALVEKTVFGTPLENFWDAVAAQEYFDSFTVPTPPDKSQSIQFQQQFREQSTAYEQYQSDLVRYNAWVSEGKRLAQELEDIQNEMDIIATEKEETVKKANLPTGFAIIDDGLYFNGMPFMDMQISESQRIAATLKLARHYIGEVQAMYFDASHLDKNSLADIFQWADQNGLQLLVERADYHGGDIQYEIIQHL